MLLMLSVCHTCVDCCAVKQVIKMLLAIVLLFAVCWSPKLVDNVLIEFGIVDRFHHGYLRYARQAFALMSYANSCVNPVVYAFMSRNFRAGFRKAIGCNGSAFLPPRTNAQMGGSPRVQQMTFPAANSGHCSGEMTLFIRGGMPVGSRRTPPDGSTGSAVGRTVAGSRDNLAPSAELPEYCNSEQ